LIENWLLGRRVVCWLRLLIDWRSLLNVALLGHRLIALRMWISWWRLLIAWGMLITWLLVAWRRLLVHRRLLLISRWSLLVTLRMLLIARMDLHAK
jgi:hypothetical protein